MDIINFFFGAVIVFIIVLLIGVSIVKVKETKKKSLNFGAIGTFEESENGDAYNHF